MYNKKIIFHWLCLALVFILFASIIPGCGGGASNTVSPAGAGTTTGNTVEYYVYVPAMRIEIESNSKAAPAGYSPLEGARVTVVGIDKYALTNSQGYAKIENISSGTYTITISKSGYQTISYTNVSISISSSSTSVEIESSTVPGIIDLSATSGTAGAAVIITGVNFGSSQGTSTVKFNGVSASATSWSDTQIVCAVPTGTTTGNIVVTVGGASSNAISFTVIATGGGGSSGAPQITGISPSSGFVGSSVTITGAGFGGIQGKVYFGSTQASSITSWTDTRIVATTNVGGLVKVVDNNKVQSNIQFYFTAFYTVTYYGNGSTGGSVPVDTYYVEGDPVTVLGNTGSLVKVTDGYSWVLARWNTKADGTGTDYTPGVSTFTVGTANVELYAKWPYAPGPAGGLICYDKGSYSGGWRYLEAAPSNQSTSQAWSNITSALVGTGTAIGTGQANTTAIIGQASHTTSAAKLCDDLTVGGYSDWFLPSKDELNTMYVNLKLFGVGGFAGSYYWSSSEYNGNNAWDQFFNLGFQNNINKGSTNYVRAVRAF